jgi:hypothetical protein
MFPNNGGGYPEMPQDFPIAKFSGTFDVCLGMQKAGVDEILRRLNLIEKEKDVCESWGAFWEAVPKEIEMPTVSVPTFRIPEPQRTETHIVAKKRPAAVLDSGNRPIQVVTHQNFSHSDRNRAKKQRAEEGLESSVLEKIEKGDVLVLNLLPQNNDNYKLPFVLANVDSDIANIDTTDKNAKFRVQILRPIDMSSITNKFVKWQGDDNHLWKPFIKRKKVRIVVSLTKGKKLTAASQALIKSTYPSYFS